MDYRKAMTWVAFWVEETKEYKKIFPSESESFELNMAKIDWLINNVNNNIWTVYSTVLWEDFYRDNYYWWEPRPYIENKWKDIAEVKESNTYDKEVVTTYQDDTYDYKDSSWQWYSYIPEWVDPSELYESPWSRWDNTTTNEVVEDWEYYLNIWRDKTNETNINIDDVTGL
jgi:hypothetical protein